jgi:hypothetical protein
MMLLFIQFLPGEASRAPALVQFVEVVLELNKVSPDGCTPLVVGSSRLTAGLGTVTNGGGGGGGG